MTIPELKKALAKKIKAANKEWNEVAEKDRGPSKPKDYLDVGNVNGRINAYMEILTMLS